MKTFHNRIYLRAMLLFILAKIALSHELARHQFISKNQIALGLQCLHILCGICNEIQLLLDLLTPQKSGVQPPDTIQKMLAK